MEYGGVHQHEQGKRYGHIDKEMPVRLAGGVGHPVDEEEFQFCEAALYVVFPHIFSLSIVNTRKYKKLYIMRVKTPVGIKKTRAAISGPDFTTDNM
jgi:hypothetical protein